MAFIAAVDKFQNLGNRLVLVGHLLRYDSYQLVEHHGDQLGSNGLKIGFPLNFQIQNPLDIVPARFRYRAGQYAAIFLPDILCKFFRA